jgi:hypothetical protein
VKAKPERQAAYGSYEDLQKIPQAELEKSQKKKYIR